MTFRLMGWLVLLVLFPLLAGCGRGWSEISGTVRYQGKPLPKGSITFYDAANQAVSSSIDADGKYALRKVAAGKVKVTVMLPMFIAMAGDKKGMARMAAERKTLPNLPTHYADAEKSGLNRDVKTGSQTINFDLD